MLAERDLKIEQLGGQLEAASSAMSAQPNQDAASGPAEVEGRIPCNPAFDGMSDLKLEFQGQIMKLQQYIEANNLRHVDPLGAHHAPLPLCPLPPPALRPLHVSFKPFSFWAPCYCCPRPSLLLLRCVRINALLVHVAL